MSDPKLMDPQFTHVINGLSDLHDKLFPGSKHLTPGDIQFIKAHGTPHGIEQVPITEAEKLKTEIKRLREAMGQANIACANGDHLTAFGILNDILCEETEND